ncbi:MAG: MFS transporter [Syntrophobacteraceae bacterium]|nr:MFS transporter [Syntrophobacteraceae bacterium]
MIGPTVPACDEGVIRAAARPLRCPEGSKRWVLAAAILGSSMAFIDTSVVNVALPAIQADLALPLSRAQWIVNAYMLMLGSLVLLGGSAGDRFGRRRVFAAGAVLFTAASIACGLAPGATALITARAIQGVGGALLIPSSLAIVSGAFPERERGRAIGSWAGASALTTALGPVLGGWLVDTWSWRAIFFVNVPIASVLLFLTFRHVPEGRSESEKAALDWPGALLATAGLGAIAYGLTSASGAGWMYPLVSVCLLAGVSLLGIFLWWEAHTVSPMMPLGLFRSGTFSGANTMTILLYFALGGALFFVPFDLVRIQHYPATLAGAAFLPFSLIMGGLSRWSGALIDRYGARRPLIIGPLIASAGFALLAVPGIGGSYWTTFFPAMVVLGFGMAVSVAPLTTTVMGAVEDSHAGIASGTNNAAARIAGMLAVAVLGTLAVGVFARTLDQRLTQLGTPPEIRQALQAEAPKLAEAEVPARVGAQRRSLQLALAESFVSSFRAITLVAASLALLSALCAWLTIHPSDKAGQSRP